MDSSMREFKIISKHRMNDQYLIKLRACVETLDEQVLWQVGEGETNSIGGIINHIMVHVRRNAAKLIDPTITYKQGMEDSFTPSLQDKVQLMVEVEEAFSSFCAALDNTGSIDMYNVYHVVEHTAYHLGQIIDRVQRLADHRFQFVQTGLNEKALRAIVQQSLNTSEK
ncbi:MULTISPECIES: DinB family protein [unclassified Paenibacillus]|uniref:DinB family protein n=1 Tax=unclassified Paenibacillus TaxID=185978 RepID=UPI0038363266